MADFLALSQRGNYHVAFMASYLENLLDMMWSLKQHYLHSADKTLSQEIVLCLNMSSETPFLTVNLQKLCVLYMIKI